MKDSAFTIYIILQKQMQ